MSQFRQSILWRPTKPESRVKNVSREFQFSCPLGNRKVLSIEFNEVTFPHIVLLLFISSPSAIAWLIIAIIVDAVNAVKIRRSPSHVRNEVVETFQPTLADSNSTPSVIFLVFTSAYHTHPYCKFWPIRLAMLFVGFGTKTTEASRCSTDKMLAKNCFGFASLAEAIPKCPADSWILAFYGEPSENLPSQLKWLSHGVSHVGVSKEGVASRETTTVRVPPSHKIIVRSDKMNATA